MSLIFKLNFLSHAIDFCLLYQHNILVPNNLTKVATVDPREIKKIGADTHRLPLEIEIENPYRDAVILNEMAKATSKDEVVLLSRTVYHGRSVEAWFIVLFYIQVLEIHEDLEDLYQKRHTWQSRPAIQPENVWTGAKFSLPQGEDAQSVYSKDNNGIPKGNTLTRNPGQIQTANFVQVKILVL